MSSLRNLVTGSDVCAPSDSTRSGNAVGALVNTLLQRVKPKDRSRQDGASSSTVSNFFEDALQQKEKEPLMHEALPEETQVPVMDPDTMFSNEFHQFERIFDEASVGQLRPPEAGADVAVMGIPEMLPPDLQSERDRAISGAMQSFLACARDDIPFTAVPFPSHLTFNPLEQQKIGARVQHLCHVIFADHGPDIAEMQVSRFLNSIGIGAVTSQLEEFDRAWNGRTSWQSRSLGGPSSRDLMDEFQRLTLQPRQWQQHQEWIDQFAQLQQRVAPPPAPVETQESEENAKDVSSALIQQMANDSDPKFRNSKFLQFVQKLQSGELVIEGNEIKQGQVAPGQTFAGAEMQNIQQSAVSEGNAWFSDSNHQDTVEWSHATLEGGWLDSAEIQDWVENYNQMAYGPLEEDKAYEFAVYNPFRGNPNALQIAQDLFARGNLNEAALAAEAAAQATDNNVEPWILLGKIHAENDNDTQAIAALNQGRSLAPDNLEILLDLGVCHANELHERKTVEALTSWLQHHPQYHSNALVNTPPPDPSQELSHSMRTFHQILSENTSDVDVLVALGVLHHLGRNFEEAINLFQSAATLRPTDHTLWNKLGATQANAARSGEAIATYQRSLQQKPNYMRGWANLGISCGNVGDYAQSVQHYVRALSLNRDSDTVWSYLRSSAICAGFTDLLNAIDARDLEVLKRQFSRE